VRRSEFATAYGEGATLDAEAAGARWEPEPAAGLPAEALAEIETGIEDYLEVGGELRMALVNSIADRLAPLWPRPQPAGPGCERRPRVPVLMLFRGFGASGRLLYDIWPAGEPTFRMRIDPDGDLIIRELLDYYNAPPAPAGWPAPRLGREGLLADPEAEMLYWDGKAWLRCVAEDIRDEDWWLPQPPPPPVAP
jgi:hypothetical protein